MATQVQRRKGTTVQHSTFTGASAELTVDTTKNTVVVHNGATAGGFPLAKDSEVVHLTGAETIAGVKTLSSNPILSAGTANGVTYLNGSKVLTSGSALTFDGTNINVTNGVLTSQSATGGNGYVGAIGTAMRLVNLNATGSTDVLGNADILLQTAGNNPIKFNIAFSEQMRLTSTGLGIGTSSTGERLTVQSAETYTASFNNTVQDVRIRLLSGGVDGGQISASATDLNLAGASVVKFLTNGAERARIDTSGNYMVGATSALGRVTIVQGTTSNADTLILKSPNAAGAGSQAGIRFLRDTNAVLAQILADTSTGALITSVNGAERARITSSGNLLVNTTSQLSEGKLCVAYSYASNQGIVLNETAGSAGQDAIRFNVQSTKVGSVSVTTTATAYNTSSDYRLKNITGPITTSGVYIDSLNPVEGTWKTDGSTFVGLLAHEAQEASRTQVATGTKDGEEMQGMSYSSSEMIANMVAELKALRARVAALEAA